MSSHYKIIIASSEGAGRARDFQSGYFDIGMSSCLDVTAIEIYAGGGGAAASGCTTR